MNIKKWLRQPSTIDGIGWLIGVAAGAAAHVVTKQTSDAAAVCVVAKGAVHLLINDSTAEAPVDNSLESLVRDSVTAIATKKLEAAIPTLTVDVLKLVTTGQAALAQTTAAAAIATPSPPPAAAPASAPAPAAVPAAATAAA